MKTERDITSRIKPQISTGVNFDYILILRQNGETYQVEKRQIDRHRNLLENIVYIVESDNYSVEDLFNSVKNLPRKDLNLGLCSLSSRYVSKPFLPDISKNIYSEYQDDYNFRSIKERNYYDDRSCKLKNLENQFIRKYGYLKRIDNERFEEKKYDYIHKEMLYWEHLKKRSYAYYIMRYIYALDYDYALQGVENDSSVAIYSHEKMGYVNSTKRGSLFQKPLTDDLEIIVNTNFCYGDSSYFNIVVRYKGIMICPYSAWVRFYNAGYNELLKHTRQYTLLRENWENCFDFVSYFVNTSISDPEKFVKELIVKEVVDLRTGLEKILNMPLAMIKRRMATRSLKSGNYLGIKNLTVANDADIAAYEIHGDDLMFIWKTEKIAHAINFLESLRALEQITDEVNTTINYIIDKSISIKYEVDEKLNHVSSLFHENKESLQLEEEKLRAVSSKFAPLKSLLERRIRKRKEGISEKEVIIQFYRDSPDFEHLENEYNSSIEKIKILQHEVNRYRGYMNRLETVKKEIESLGKLP